MKLKKVKKIVPAPSPKISLKSEEVCAIIRACGESGVRVLKFAELYVQFGPKAEPERQSPDPRVMDKAKSEEPSSTDTEMSATAIQIDQETLAKLEDQAKRERVQRLMLENPGEYERLLSSGDLEDDPDFDSE